MSVTAGTIFDRSRVQLADWFTAVRFMTNQKYGVSALGLQRLLGLGSYQTAWTMLRKLRAAMVRPGRDRLQGTLAVDETYVGGIADVQTCQVCWRTVRWHNGQFRRSGNLWSKTVY